MNELTFLLAMAFGALVALAVSWPFWIWRMDRLERRTIEWVNEVIDEGRGDD